MIYFFDSKTAEKYGVNEAIIIQNIKFWVEKNKANGKHLHDGRTWTFNSVKAFSILFPFWKPYQIRNILENLIKKEVLITGNFNKVGYDRTLWYAFKDENAFIEIDKSICENSQIEITEIANRFNNFDKPIPYRNTNLNTNEKKDIPFPPVGNNQIIPEDLIEIIKYIQSLKILSEERKFLREYKSGNGLTNSQSDIELLLQIKQVLADYSISDIKKAADNYKLLLEDESNYHISSPYTRILSFIAKGVPGFIDLDIAKKRCKIINFKTMNEKNKNSDNEVRYTINKCLICGTETGDDKFCVKCDEYVEVKTRVI